MKQRFSIYLAFVVLFVALTAKATAQTPALGREFGKSLAVSGNTAIIGAVESVNKGVVYVYYWNGATWIQQQKLEAEDGSSQDGFGNTLAISGDTAIIGAPERNEKTGAVYVFVRNGSNWTQQQKIELSDGEKGDFFGNDLAIEKNIFLAGISNDRKRRSGVYVFERSGTVWRLQQKLSLGDAEVLGSVAINDDRVAVSSQGAHGEGSVYIFARNGASWTEEQKIVSSEPELGLYFGMSVALGPDTLVVGAPAPIPPLKTFQGVAYVFARKDKTWQLQQKLTAPDGTFTFAGAVALSGNTAVILKPDSLIYIFTRNGGKWTLQKRLPAKDSVANSFAINGDIVLIGSPGMNNGEGVVQIFVRSGKTWIQQHKLVAQ